MRRASPRAAPPRLPVGIQGRIAPQLRKKFERLKRDPTEWDFFAVYIHPRMLSHVGAETDRYQAGKVADAVGEALAQAAGEDGDDESEGSEGDEDWEPDSDDGLAQDEEEDVILSEVTARDVLELEAEARGAAHGSRPAADASQEERARRYRRARKLKRRQMEEGKFTRHVCVSAGARVGGWVGG